MALESIVFKEIHSQKITLIELSYKISVKNLFQIV